MPDENSSLSDSAFFCRSSLVKIELPNTSPLSLSAEHEFTVSSQLEGLLVIDFGQNRMIGIESDMAFTCDDSGNIDDSDQGAWDCCGLIEQNFLEGDLVIKFVDGSLNQILLVTSRYEELQKIYGYSYTPEERLQIMRTKEEARKSS